MTALATVSPWLRCPVCGAAPELTGRSLICPEGHGFDVAKQGYVNLLGRAAPANADTADMVAARDRFLSAGHYDPITNAVATAAPGHTDSWKWAPERATTWHESSTSGRRPTAWPRMSQSPPADAPQSAPRMAAVVADTWAGLPLADGSVDAVLCIFAPRHPAEFARVLTDDGVAVVVLPGPITCGNCVRRTTSWMSGRARWNGCCNRHTVTCHPSTAPTSPSPLDCRAPTPPTS